MTKRILHLILFLSATTIGISQTTSVVADWDGTDLVMGGSFGNGHFGDSTFAIVANPNPSGINMSANVQNWQKANDAATWGGFYYDPAELVDLSGGVGEICVNVQSDHDFLLRLKVEGSGNGGADASFNSYYCNPGEWQQVCFNVIGPDVNGDMNTQGYSYSRITLFPEFGNVPAADASYYFDDIVKRTGGPAAPAPTTVADWDGTDLTIGGSFGNGHFGDSIFAIVANPNVSGINMSANVQNWQKANDAATWGGFYYDPPEMLDLSGAYGEVCVNVYNDYSFKLRLKLEGSTNGGANASFDKYYCTPGEWQQICYNVMGADINGDVITPGFNYGRITFFPEHGSAPAVDASYYFDDIQKVTGGDAGGLPPGGIWISDYEPAPDGITVPMLSSFGNGHYGSDLFDVIANPAPGGSNSSSLVQEWCKANDAQTWGGWTLGLGATDTLNFTGTQATICLSVYADEASLIRLKLEGSPTGDDLRIDQDYTTPGAWQNLCFDFTQPDVNGLVGLGHLYFTMSLFPDNGTVPAADKCFYFDNIYKITDGVGDPAVFISDVIKESADHTILEDLIILTDLWGAVDATDATVFAPTDAALNALPAAELDALMNNTDNAAFNFILFHVARAPFPSSDLNMGMNIIMANGYDAEVTAANSAISNATISDADVDNSNGVLHFTSSVMEYPDVPGPYLFEDFEGTFTGNQWAGFNWGSAAANQWVEANPAPDAINGSATVMRSRKYPQDQGANDFQGIVVRQMDRRFNFIGNRTRVCVDVNFAEVGSRFRWKFELGLIDGTDLRYEAANTVAGQWEKVCANVTDASLTDPFTPAAGNIYPQLAIFFDYEAGTWPAAETDYFFDNLEVYNEIVDGTEDVSELKNFKMFPNPATDILTIKTDSPVEYAVIYNATGLEMEVVTNPLDRDINVAYLSTGVYYILFLDKDAAQMGVTKFVKQ